MKALAVGPTALRPLTGLSVLVSTLLLVAVAAPVPAVAGDPVVTRPLAEAARARMHASGIVGSGVIDALDRGDKARVMIAFSVPGAPGAGGGSQRFAAPAARADLDTVTASILGGFGAAEFDVRHRFRSVNALAGEISASGVLRLLDNPNVRRVDLDEGGSAQLAQAVPLVNLDVLHGLGFTGAGATVAVLDSGVDTDHADLSDDLVAQQCFCSDFGAGCCPDGNTTQSGAGAAEDDNGHGTNVAGVITSRGTVAPLGGAPDAQIVAVKVLDNAGNFCCSSDIVAGLDWIINNRPDVDAVNMSLGTFALFTGDCDNAAAWTIALATAIDTLRANGVLSFASAGNNGSGTSMSAPACIANAISVGAVWDSNVGSRTVGGCTDATTAADKVTCFSNSNSTTDLFAPGAPTTSTGLAGGTSTYYGTSQASPLAVACAAVLLDKAPALTPDEIESAMESSTTLVTDATNGLSFARLDCEEAADFTPGGLCAAAPVAGCRTAAKSLLLMKEKGGTKDKLIWKWIKGAPTSQAEFGNPTATGDYALCVYDASGTLLTAEVSADATKWSAIPNKGYKYKDPAGIEDGIQKIILKGSAESKAKALVKGKGANLPDPALGGIPPPVTVQLINSDTPVCWEAVYDAGDIIKNESDQFKAKR